MIGIKSQLFQKEPKNLNEFAPDETLALLVPLGERLLLRYFTIKHTYVSVKYYNRIL